MDMFFKKASSEALKPPWMWLLISDEQWKKDPFMVGIPFSCDFALSLYQGRAFEKGVCIFKGRSLTTHLSAGGGGPSWG